MVLTPRVIFSKKLKNHISQKYSKYAFSNYVNVRNNSFTGLSTESIGFTFWYKNELPKPFNAHAQIWA